MSEREQRALFSSKRGWIGGAILAFWVALMPLCALDDLGTHGALYEISEPDFFDKIRDPAVRQRVEKAASRVRDSILDGLRADGTTGGCLTTGVRYFEPVYILDRDIVLPDGKVLYKKGYRFNILERMKKMGGSFRRNILFVDADSPVQQAFVRKYAKGGAADVIVVRGNGERLREEGVRIMVANDTITGQFDLKCLPSYYIQKGNRFEIHEYTEKWLISKGVSP